MAGNDGDVDTAALGAIRPGDPKERLAAAIGERWLDPAPALAGRVGYFEQDFRFTARLDRDGNVGEIRFHFDFDPSVTIEGLRMLMPEDEIAKTLPHLKLSEPSAAFPYRIGYLELANGALLGVEVGHGRVTRIWIDNPQAIYPDKGPMPLALPASSFDVAIVPGLQPRGTVAPDGWACGLPRGIKPMQWPLSNRTGFPLEHHFTVRVPEAYRVKGEQYVALALFSDAGEESRRSPAVSDLMNIVFDGRSLPATVEDELQPFLDHLRNRHPMEFRSKDILYATFAAIWLTKGELKGAECEPPQPVKTSANQMCALPHWLGASAAERMFGWDGSEAFNPNYGLHRIAGRKPLDKWELLLLKMSERHDDPNTGRQPVEFFDSPGNVDGYVPRYSEQWDALGIDMTYGDLHFGGTAGPAQAMPDLTPFYIEFEETMGMINFGGGNGQLDLMTMQIDWGQ